MSRLGLAFRVFWRVLTDAIFAQGVAPLLAGPAAAPAPPIEKKPAAPEIRPPLRSEALTLLAVLQREARLVDFLQEPIATYSDAQVGAAVRDIHRDSAAALDRLFALKPLLEQVEGASIEIPAGFDAARYCLTGNVSGAPPFRGTLRHPGWVATRVNLPEWTGSAQSANVVAAAEVELA
jgi:hypothetical protein